MRTHVKLISRPDPEPGRSARAKKTGASIPARYRIDPFLSEFISGLTITNFHLFDDALTIELSGKNFLRVVAVSEMWICDVSLWERLMPRGSKDPLADLVTLEFVPEGGSAVWNRRAAIEPLVGLLVEELRNEERGTVLHLSGGKKLTMSGADVCFGSESILYFRAEDVSYFSME
ncbi:MAG: hypothetical protein NUW37_19330 [Planctomycetes bacterium]|nr:hypothetical protein [Planctomycetota bacterium]